MTIEATFSLTLGFAATRWNTPALSQTKALASLSSRSEASVTDATDSFWKQIEIKIDRSPAYFHVYKISDALLDVRPEEAKLLLATLPTTLSPSDRNIWIRGLISLWAEKDPVAALKAIEANVEFSSNLGILSQVFAAWANQDSAEAISYAKQMLPGAKRGSALQGALYGLAQKDPQMALNLAEGTLAYELKDETVNQLYLRLAAQDPRAALQRALRRSNIPESIDPVMIGIMQTWAHQDLAGARAALSSAKNERSLQEMLMAVTKGSLKDDPEGAAAFLATFLPKDIERNSLLFNSYFLFGQILGEDDKIKRFVAKLPPGPLMQPYQDTMWQHRMALDPEGVWEENTSLPPGPQRTRALRRWGFENPAQALQKAEMLSGEDRIQVSSAAINRWASEDPAAVINYVTQPGREALQTNAFENIVSTLGQMPTDTAQALLAQIPASSRAAPLKRYIETVAFSDPDLALSLLQKNFPENEQIKVLREITYLTANQNPAQAAHWLKALPEGEEKISSSRNLASVWSDFDSGGVTAWLNQLPVSASRDGAVEQFVNKARSYDPESSTLWAATISDEKKQQAGVTESWKEWNRRNPSAAQAWLTNASLSPALKKSLNP